ncbi:MAG: hypothetical protein ACOYEV_02975 [Candidatus Nanopelagicales bacterium]
MAELLIEQWELSVLRVMLDVSEQPVVRCTLSSYLRGRPRQLWSRAESLESFGLADLSTRSVPSALEVPGGLREAVLETLHNELQGRAALWLRIVPPSGFLGAVPWETALLPAADVPVLRVPDRLPIPADSGGASRVAMLVNAEPGQEWGAAHVLGFTEALSNSWRDQGLGDLEVDAFCDAGTAKLLASPAAELAPTVRVHRPRPEQSSRSSSPFDSWKQWMTSGLKGRSVRVLHVASAAGMDLDVPWLSISRDPGCPDELASCGYAAAEQVRRLADALGAPVLSFASPPGNPADLATRLMADSSGVVRSGPTVYVDLGSGSAEPELARLLALLASPGHGPDGTLPRSPRLFAYLQPEQVAGYLAEPPPPLTMPADVPKSLLAAGNSAERSAVGEMPGWVATSERFVDTQVSALIRGSAGARSVETKVAYDKGLATALADVRAMISRHAQEK